MTGPRFIFEGYCPRCGEQMGIIEAFEDVELCCVNCRNMLYTVHECEEDGCLDALWELSRWRQRH